MKRQHITVLGLVGIVTLALLQAGCCRRLNEISLIEKIVRNTNDRVVRDTKDKVVTISVSLDDASKCDVDYPVTFLRIRKDHTITWASADQRYFVLFQGNVVPVGTTSGTSRNIPVPAGGDTGRLIIKIDPSQAGYFQYAIYTVDPIKNPTANPCKKYDEDHDTGLNVKP